MRRAARVDDNHAKIVASLRLVGCTVLDLSAVGQGCPDIMVGLAGVNYLIEIKDGRGEIVATFPYPRKDMAESEAKRLKEANRTTYIVCQHKVPFEG